MIRTKNSRPAKFIFNLYLDRLLKKNFSAFYLVNCPDISLSDKLLLTPNHFSWWDGFFADYMVRHTLKRHTKIMMLEEQLRKYPFFSKVGAFSIKPGSPKDIIESFGYAAGLMQDTSNCTVIYPQGEIEPYDKFPPGIKPGLSRLISSAPTDLKIIPLAFRITYNNEKYPFVSCRFGQAVDKSSMENDYSCFSNAFNDNIIRLNEASIKGEFTLELFGSGEKQL